MPNPANHAYRVSLVTAVTLAFAYAMGLSLPFIAPLFAFLLAAKSEKAVAMKGMVGLLLLITITLGAGLLLIPLLTHYPFTGLLLVFIGIFFSNQLMLNKGKGLVGLFFMFGVTLISIMGTVDFSAAGLIINTILVAVICAIVAQWLIFPFFPVAPRAEAPAAPAANEAGLWIAIRTTVIVFPVYLLTLTNPTLYLPMVMKAVSLGQQSTDTELRAAGQELVTSTLLAGLLAVAFWLLLQVHPVLWIFFLLSALFTLGISRRLFGLVQSRYPPSFWQNTMITLLLLIGPAVQDTLTGKDVYKAFTVRISLFIAVSFYAWFATQLLENIKSRRLMRLAQTRA